MENKPENMNNIAELLFENVNEDAATSHLNLMVFNRYLNAALDGVQIAGLYFKEIGKKFIIYRNNLAHGVIERDEALKRNGNIGLESMLE